MTEDKKKGNEREGRMLEILVSGIRRGWFCFVSVNSQDKKKGKSVRAGCLRYW